MQDNSTIKVEFQDKRNSSSVINSSNTVYCKLTDGYQPSALKVNVIDNRTLEIEYSEAVLRGKNVAGTSNALYAADREENYTIDARSLDYYGIKKATEPEQDSSDDDDQIYITSEKHPWVNRDVATGSVRVLTYRNGVDKRNIVRIQMGEGSALPAGRHSLAISNVGDWAASSDGWRNIINTATLDFEIPDNNEAPKFDYEVMSPEQIKLTANCDFGIVEQGKTFTVPNSANEGKDIVILEQYKAGKWEPISDEKYTDLGCGNNPIMVSRIYDVEADGTRTATNEYLVETTVDWTRVHDTKNNHVSYNNNTYRLRIPAGSIRNLANSKTNDEITINISEDPMMKTLDTTSPKIKSIEQAQDRDGNLVAQYHVTFDEPVKLTNQSNWESTTPTQDVDRGSIYSAYFVKRDGGKQVQAVVYDNSFVDAVDTTIQVNPVDKLDAGDWDLYVRGIADDYGNTITTESGMIHIDEEVVKTDFEVVWAAVSKDGKYSGITAGEGHFILVKFNKPISYFGGSANATSTLNYQINGKPLPTGSKIEARIVGYDDEYDGAIDSITIKLPDGTNSSGLGSTTMNYPVNGRNCILTISDAIKSEDGDTLSVEAGYNMPYQYGENGTLAVDKTDFGLSTLGDAVWGNDKTEQYGHFTSSSDPQKAYINAFKEALKSNKYRKVQLDRNAAGTRFDLGTLNIDRIVTIDLNGCDILGNITFDTKTAADGVQIINTNPARKSVITGKKTEKGSATVTINTPNSNAYIGENIEIVRATDILNNDGSAYTPAIKVNSVKSDTLTSAAKVIGEFLIAGNGVGVRNEGAGDLSEATVRVDTTGTVSLKGDFSSLPNGKGVLLAKKVTVNLKKILDDIEIVATVKDSTIVAEDIANGKKVTVKATADDIVVKYNDPSKVELVENGGTFKQQTLLGDEHVDPIDPTSGEEQKWIEGLRVIDGSDGNTLTEIITVGAVSGGSFFKCNNEQNIFTGFSKLASASTDNAKYSVEDMGISVKGYLSYVEKGQIKVSESAKDLKVKTPSEITFTVIVKNKETNITTTITKKIKVTIDPDQK